LRGAGVREPQRTALSINHKTGSASSLIACSATGRAVPEGAVPQVLLY